jgi:hypothetical protein
MRALRGSRSALPTFRAVLLLVPLVPGASAQSRPGAPPGGSPGVGGVVLRLVGGTAACSGSPVLDYEACASVACRASEPPVGLVTQLLDAMGRDALRRTQSACEADECRRPQLREKSNSWACDAPRRLCVRRSVTVQCPRSAAGGRTQGAQTPPSRTPPPPRVPPERAEPQGADVPSRTPPPGHSQPTLGGRDRADGRPRDAVIQRIHLGEDGGYLFSRTEGGGFVAYGEHPTGLYAFVARGKVVQDTIQAEYWDVPKAARQRTGSITLSLEQGGARLRFAGGDGWGPNVMNEITPSAVDWPRLNMRAAGFQSTSTGSLTGAFEGAGPSRHYVRQAGDRVAWVAEKSSQPGERPGWVAVFIGDRQANAGPAVTGRWYEVIKGLETRAGSFDATVTTPKASEIESIFSREVDFGTGEDGRFRRLTPDYAIDFDRFEAKLKELLDGRFVGYAYAIASKGGILRHGGGGSRRLSQDGRKEAFGSRTFTQAASFSKTFTAVTLARALQKRGLTFDDRAAPFAPPCFELGSGWSEMKFAQLAGHRSGLNDAELTARIPNWRDPWEWTRGIFEIGRTDPVPPGLTYQNANYGILRYLIAGVAEAASYQQVFQTRDCAKDGAAINTVVSNLFAKTQRASVFEPLEIEGEYVPTTNVALVYDINKPKQNGIPPNPEGLLKAGAGYLSVSAFDAAVFLSRFEGGDIVPAEWVRLMKRNRYGFDSWESGKAGGYLWKNGGCPGSLCASWGMLFPGGVQAYVAVNSSGIPLEPAQNLGQVLAASFDAALR